MNQKNLYHTIIKFYPKTFLQRYQKELMETFIAGLHQAKAENRMAAFYLQTIKDLSQSLLKTHLEYDSAAQIQRFLLFGSSVFLTFVFAITTGLSNQIAQLEQTMTFPVTVINNQPTPELALWWHLSRITEIIQVLFSPALFVFGVGLFIALLRFLKQPRIEKRLTLSGQWAIAFLMVVVYLLAITFSGLTQMGGFALTALWIALTVTFWKSPKHNNQLQA
jgi:hypothetical protein